MTETGTPYLDTILVECDRQSASVKSTTDNGTWVNKQNNSLMLLPNDKVSVYSSYVNDVGSGQDNPIEYRGKSLNKTKIVKYTINSATMTTYVPAIKEVFPIYGTAQTLEREIELQDNRAEMVTNFYKTMDGLNYIQLPRRFIPRTSELAGSGIGEDKFWGSPDSARLGRTLQERPYLDPNPPVAGNTEENNWYGYVPEDIRGFLNYEAPVLPATAPALGDPIYFILKNDNSRYTIMEKTRNVFPAQPGLRWGHDATTVTGNQKIYHPPYYAREPEFFDYIITRERIILDADEGFSAAKTIADRLTRQMQRTRVLEREDFPDKLTPVTLPAIHGPAVDVALNKEITSNTYQAFEAGNEYQQQEVYYKRALFNGPLTTLADITTPANGVHLVIEAGPPPQVYGVEPATDTLASWYYAGFRYIACKRPEIYETGCQLNDIFGIATSEAYLPGRKILDGLVIDMPYFATDDGKVTGTILEPRTPSPQLLKYKAFLDAQGKYNELFSSETIRKILPPGQNNYFNAVSGAIRFSTLAARFSHMDTFVHNDIQYANCDVVSFDVNRFDHAAPSGPKNEFWKLGNSYYNYAGTSQRPGTNPADPPTFNRDINNDKSQSKPFYFYYDSTQSEEFYENPCSKSIFISDTFSYGAFGKTIAGDIASNNENHVIIYPNLLSWNKSTLRVSADIGLPDSFFHTYSDGSVQIKPGTKMGFDRHWNAWGTSMINLQSGKGEQGYANTTTKDGAGLTSVESGTRPMIAGTGLAQPDVTFPIFGAQAWSTDRSAITAQLDATPYNNKLYIGADKPVIGFDGTNFYFENLHTPLNKGNLLQTDPADTTANPDFYPDDGAKDVYKINPEQQYEMYSPVQFPYNRPSSYYLAGSTDERKLKRLNFNLEPLTIYDTTTGIFIEDFGYTEETWESGLWGRMGFTYGQFHASALSRNQKINNNNSDTLNIVTTNAEVDCVDTKSWAQNQFGVTKYNGELLVNYTIPISDTPHSGTGHAAPIQLIRWIPPINQEAKSIKIFAQNYPISMFNGYYNIRSDITGDSSFVDGTGNTRMPIVSIVSKQNPVGDFYITPETDIQFTITKPTRLSSINIQITEPDGSPAAGVSERSSVIFKIQRTRMLKTNIAQEVFEKLQEEIKEYTQ
mgnify:CR=1 FL=1